MQQCGLCSALAEVFRRLLCIGGSRRGSGESYYQELEDEEAVSDVYNAQGRNFLWLLSIYNMKTEEGEELYQFLKPLTQPQANITRF